MYADMPRMFSDILLSLGASRKVLDGVLRQIRHDMLPLRFYALFRLRGATDLPRVPLYYRLGYAVFGRSIIVAWKTYRLAHGRGFTLPPIY